MKIKSTILPLASGVLLLCASNVFSDTPTDTDTDSDDTDQQAADVNTDINLTESAADGFYYGYDDNTCLLFPNLTECLGVDVYPVGGGWSGGWGRWGRGWGGHRFGRGFGGHHHDGGHRNFGHREGGQRHGGHRQGGHRR